MSDDNKDKLLAARQVVKETLEDKGLFVEEMSAEIGLQISLTKFGLPTMYATVPESEIQYLVDNDLEI